MNPDDIIKAAPGIAKGAAEIIAAVPIADIVKRICGPPADLLGEKLRERVERCFEKTARMTEDAGFTPQAVPPKLLFPILQGASLEEDEDLHTMWAALLANAASPEDGNEVRPGFIATLRQMAPDEAVLLNWIHEHSADLAVNVIDANAFVSNLPVCLDSLEAAQLIRRGDLQASDLLYGTGESSPSTLYSMGSSRATPFAQRHNKSYVLTDRGRAFISACQPPKHKV